MAVLELSHRQISEEKENFKKLAATRNEAFTKQEPFIPRTSHKAALVDGLGWWFFKDAKLVGQDNLIQAQEMAKNTPHTLTPNHNSDGDHEALMRTLSVNGYEDFAHTLGFLAGWKMIDRWYIKMFMGAQPAFISVPPGDLKTMLEMKAEMKKTPEDEILWQTYRNNIRDVSNKVKKHVHDWEEAGNATVLYVQGGRLKAPYIVSSPDKAMDKFFQDNRIITPVNSKGVDKMVPTNKIINPFKRGKIQIEVGRPYHTDNLKELLEDRVIKDAGINAVDIALARIINISPFLPHPARLSEEFRVKFRVLECRDPYMQKAA